MTWNLTIIRYILTNCLDALQLNSNFTCHFKILVKSTCCVIVGFNNQLVVKICNLKYDRMAFPRKPRCRDKNEHIENCPPQRSESKLEIFKKHFESLTKLKETEVWILTHN